MSSVPPVSTQTRAAAVFLSYASQDTVAARKIAEALAQGGVEVWFDQSELRGGDAWDQSIRRQIKNCALFIPILSKNTHERDEGYFRLEWKLAVDRSHLITSNKAFLLPVVVDDTPEDDEQVPERFREVQWTRLPGGEASDDFVERVKRLLSHEPTGRASTPRMIGASVKQPTSPSTSRLRSLAPTVIAVTLTLILTALAADRIWTAKRTVSPGSAANVPADAAGSAGTVFKPPPHSIAVLPFENLSGDKEQDYFSDGLSEELLNSLSRINELQVAARTSSFYFKGMHADLSTIARKLNVGAVLEGSVRRGGHTIRVTAELINTVTGFHLWSQTYDRELSDVLQLQTDIADAVTSALRIALLNNIAQKVELGGTHNPSAFDAYLRATKADRGDLNEQGLAEALARYSDAIRLDPDFAMAYAGRAFVLNGLRRNYAGGAKRREDAENAQADAQKAIALVPDLAAGHLALANLVEDNLDFAGATKEYARALALAPGDANVLRRYGQFEVLMGHADVGLEALRRSVTLDPLNSDSYFYLGEALAWARRPADAVVALDKVKALDPSDLAVYGWLGFSYLVARDFHHAEEACERTIDANRFHCLTMAYEGLGRRADADAAFKKLIAMEPEEEGSIFIAMIYAQRGDKAQAFDWLDKAVKQREPYLEYLKTNAFLDPLRAEPRFLAIERSLHFPD